MTPVLAVLRGADLVGLAALVARFGGPGVLIVEHDETCPLGGPGELGVERFAACTCGSVWVSRWPEES